MLINNKSRDECDSVLNNQSDSLGATNHANQVSKFVILNIDKSTLEYKNNKNLILKQASIDRNRYKLSLSNNNINRSIIREAQHNFEKHLNDINQLKKELEEKRFISPSDICDNLNNMKHSTATHTVPKIEAFHAKGSEQAANDYHVVCCPEKAEGIDKNGSSRANFANILRPSNRFASPNAHENHFHGISLHESPKNTTNAKSIPCIVIQGNASDLNNKTLHGVVERAGSLTGKLLCSPHSPFPPFTSMKMFFPSSQQKSFFFYFAKCRII